jgi:hypothetical protein
MTSWLLPSTEPTVPNSADKKASRCFGVRCSLTGNKDRILNSGAVINLTPRGKL